METATPDRVAVALNPVPGFCVKSRATNDSLVRITAPDSDQPRDIRVEKGLKVFVNIAWDPNVPPPPPASDDAIHRAMRGLDIDQSTSEAWFVPIVLSDARQDSDKGRCYLHSVHVVLCDIFISDEHSSAPLLTHSISRPASHRFRLRA